MGRWFWPAALPDLDAERLAKSDNAGIGKTLVDAGRAHIKVRPHTVPSPALLALLTACPARCYERNDRGQVEITADGCVERGTCRIIAVPSGDIESNLAAVACCSSSADLLGTPLTRLMPVRAPSTPSP
jgi:ferredoxin-like protein FixX